MRRDTPLRATRNNRGLVTSKSLEERVARAAEDALDAKGWVAPIDVLVGLGWLASSRVDEWRQGRIPNLEAVAQVNLRKLSDAMHILRGWATERDLYPSETAYIARARDKHALTFSISGEPATETAYRTHWVSPALSEAKRRRLAERQSRPPELVVISALHDWSCTRCQRPGGDLLLMEGDGPICLGCAGLGHLVFLPRGDTGLTRRATRASTQTAVVVRFSRARKRYERQGVLVEAGALAQAEQHSPVEPRPTPEVHAAGAARQPRPVPPRS
jgi:hypothetical protein